MLLMLNSIEIEDMIKTWNRPQNQEIHLAELRPGGYKVQPIAWHDKLSPEEKMISGVLRC